MNYSKHFLIAACLAVGTVASAQLNSRVFSGFKLQSVQTNLGLHGDHFSRMNIDFMEQRVNDNLYQKADLSGMRQDDYVSNSAGANINISAQFVKTSGTGTISKYEAIETSLGFHFGREVMIDYYIDDPALFCGTTSANSCYSNLTYCDLQNELNLGIAYKRGLSFFNTFNIYTGLGATAGTTMGSKLMIFGNTYTSAESAEGENYLPVDERYNMNESVTGRLYVPIGAELIVMQKLRLSAETRIGLGYSHSKGNGGFSNINYAALLGIGWTL